MLPVHAHTDRPQGMYKARRRLKTVEDVCLSMCATIYVLLRVACIYATVTALAYNWYRFGLIIFA